MLPSTPMQHKIDDNILLDYDRQGLIPGPKETEEQFLARANYCLSLRETLIKENSAELPSGSFDDQEGLLQQGCNEMEKNYLIRPTWVPLAVSSQHLAPWHGGATWIFQLHESSPLGALLQVRRRPWWISVKEVITHELSHIGRMAFEEPEYEEILAYHTSNSSLRRWIGAIVQTKMESFWFVLSLLIVLLFDISSLFWGNYTLFLHVQWVKLLPIGLALWGIQRLAKRISRFSRTLEKLGTLSKHPLAVAYRLTDREIKIFSAMNGEQILNYADRQDSLRWRIIRYLFEQKACRE